MLRDLVEAGLDRRTARRVATRKEAIDPAEELDRVEAAGVRTLTWHDADYPTRLGEIYDKPPLLFVRGELDANGYADGNADTEAHTHVADGRSPAPMATPMPSLLAPCPLDGFSFDAMSSPDYWSWLRPP